MYFVGCVSSRTQVNVAVVVVVAPVYKVAVDSLVCIKPLTSRLVSRRSGIQSSYSNEKKMDYQIFLLFIFPQCILLHTGEATSRFLTNHTIIFQMTVSSVQ
jgi:hypothetical protein